MPEDDEETGIHWKIIIGAWGKMLVISCSHCQALVDEAIKKMGEDKLH